MTNDLPVTMSPDNDAAPAIPVSNLAKGHRYWPQLDGVRGIAVVAVMLAHGAYGLVSGGFLGVDLFFCLSGFLITFLLVSEWRCSGSIRLGNFYLRRILRLYPALVVTVVWAYFVWPKQQLSQFRRVAFGVLFYHANFLYYKLGWLLHTWSLSLEEQFYILYPPILLLLLIRRARIAPWLIGISLGALIARCGMTYAHVDPIFVTRSVFGRADGMLVGGLVALWLERTESETTDWRPSSGQYEVLGWICLITLTALFFISQEYSLWMATAGHSVAAVICAGLVLSTVSIHSASLLCRLLRTAPLRYLGTRSYGIYLYHFLIFVSTEGLRKPHSIANLLEVTAWRIVASLGAAELSFRLIERPFLKLKRRFEPKSQPSVHRSVQAD